MDQSDVQNKLEAARKKIAEKFGKENQTNQIGGKGTQRRKKKVVHKTVINDDKKLRSTIKKFGMQPFPDIDEVNLFKDDFTVIHFSKPEVYASFGSNTYAVMGTTPPETKSIKEMLPEVLQQLSAKEINELRTKFQGLNTEGKEGGAPGDDKDEIPTLVGANFEATSKKE